MNYKNGDVFPAGIINRGDSFRKRRSRSNSLAREDEHTKECTPPTARHDDGVRDRQRRQNDCDDDIVSHTVSLMGSRGVGKTALISQFMTSEYINAYERQRG